MKTNSYKLLSELTSIIKQNIEDIKSFQNLDDNKLNFKPSPERWSVLECLEHLNRYSDFYLPEIKKALHHPVDSRDYFKSGIIGNMLVNMVIPKPGGKKMKTFTSMNPNGSMLGRYVLEKNIENQEFLLEFIQRASKSNLNKSGIPVTFSPFIKLKLGDTLRFMAYHNQRHTEQALRNL
mgnify:CR=1 FL=1